MRKDFILVFAFIFVLLGVAYFFTELTGNVVTTFAVENDSSQDVAVSKSDALAAMEIASESIEVMKENGFSTGYVSDQLLEADVVFSQLSYVDILNSVNVSYELKAEAYDALRLVNYKEISYADILVYTDNIERAKDEAFELSDSLLVLEFQIGDFEADGVDVSAVRELQSSAKVSFSEGRYSETRNAIDNAYLALEESVADRATSAVLLRGLRGFLEQYWLYVLIFLLILFLVIYLLFARIRMYRIRKKIRNFNFEKQALEDLVIQTQKDRYKKKSISEMVYNIRYQKYMNKIDEIKQTIPVWEAKLSSHEKKIKKKSKIKKVKKKK